MASIPTSLACFDRVGTQLGTWGRLYDGAYSYALDWIRLGRLRVSTGPQGNRTLLLLADVQCAVAQVFPELADEARLG